MQPLDFMKWVMYFIFVAKKQFVFKRAFQGLTSSIGVFWSFVEIGDYWFGLPKWFQGHIVWFCLPCFIYMLWKMKPITLLSYRIAGTDIDIVIQIADIFSIQNATRVISTNTSFDFAVTKNLISPKTLQGIFLSKFYDNNDKVLDKQLNKILSNEKVVSERKSEVGGKSKLYKLGTVAEITTKNTTTTYFVAISQLNQYGNAQSSFENIKIALPLLWNYIGLRGEYGPIAVPLIGTGNARIQVTKEKVVHEIIRSFIAACSEKKFTNKMTIVISPEDYDASESKLDICELGGFLKHICHYTEIQSTKPGEGSPVL